jgi:hypothetical protein
MRRGSRGRVAPLALLTALLASATPALADDLYSRLSERASNRAFFAPFLSQQPASSSRAEGTPSTLTRRANSAWDGFSVATVEVRAGQGRDAAVLARNAATCVPGSPCSPEDGVGPPASRQWAATRAGSSLGPSSQRPLTLAALPRPRHGGPSPVAHHTHPNRASSAVERVAARERRAGDQQALCRGRRGVVAVAGPRPALRSRQSVRERHLWRHAGGGLGQRLGTSRRQAAQSGDKRSAISRRLPNHTPAARSATPRDPHQPCNLHQSTRQASACSLRVC